MAYQNTGVGNGLYTVNQLTNPQPGWGNQQQNWNYTPVVNNYPNQTMAGQQQMYPAQNALPAGGNQQIPARFVTDERDIKIQEIPMDGLSVFVKSDLSTVYLKTFDVDGVHGNTYDLRKPADTSQEQVDPLQLIMERLDRIERSLNKRRQNSRTRGNGPKNRQEEEENHDE